LFSSVSEVESHGTKQRVRTGDGRAGRADRGLDPSELVIREIEGREVQVQGRGNFRLRWASGYFLCIACCIAARIKDLRERLAALEQKKSGA
jgi:hypothetical protein